MDLMRSFIAYREQMNWFAAYAPVLNRMNKLFKNPNIAEAIQSQYPSGFYKMIMKQMSPPTTIINSFYIIDHSIGISD